MATKVADGPPILVSIEEAARLLGLSRSLVYDMAARNELPVIRFGRSVRVHRSRLKEWLDDRSAERR